ncbi:hypothetical protein ACH4FX_12175 [Streptomyces sp. NPDC018019]|uniref:hypothetical protein n=1 Tax=Streptomyces sp. NPDC018019 TaxID=3365030 RepID=UPI0037AC0EF1
MTKRTGRRIGGDPRRAGGDIAGPGGPRDRDAVIIDTTDSVLLDATSVCLMETGSGHEVVLAALLEGRINQSSERSRVLYLMNSDGAAALVTELLALAYRVGPEFGKTLISRVRRLVDEGAAEPPGGSD